MSCYMFAEPALAGSMFIFKISVKIYRSIVMIYREENMNKMKIQLTYKCQQDSGSVVERNDYYPLGMRTATGNSYPQLTTNLYKYNGKEVQTVGGLGFTDYGARMYDDFTGRWFVPDPLAEKYASISPYMYCGGNPIMYIDTDGKKIVISGTLKEKALEQLQGRMKGAITLSMDENGGALTYTVNNAEKKLKRNAKLLARIIDDQSITVNLITTHEYQTSTKNLMVGGSFMGNKVSIDSDGNTQVNAFQEVNPNVLGDIDEFKNTPGKMIMHEVSESYAGAQISKKTGINAPMATKEQGEDPYSVYNKAHNRATPQNTVKDIFYDRYGDRTDDIQKAVRVEWYVTKGFRKRIIQKL